MRLYLSSYGLGNRPERLATLVGPNRTAVVIANALDNHPEMRKKSLADQIVALGALGIAAKELDLRAYFEGKDGVKKEAGISALVWVTGGNTFVLRRAMRQSGFDKIVRDMVESGEVVYGGFSAGSVVASPHLHGLEFVDKKDDIPSGYDQEVVWEGLDLISYFIAVHYQSDHPESSLVDAEVEYFKKHDMPFKTLRDGEAIVIDEGGEEIVR
jgi:dipeptidase E